MMTSGLQLNWHCNLAADVRKTLFSRILEKISLTAGCRKFLLQRAGNFLNIFAEQPEKRIAGGTLPTSFPLKFPLLWKKPHKNQKYFSSSFRYLTWV